MFLLSPSMDCAGQFCNLGTSQIHFFGSSDEFQYVFELSPKGINVSSSTYIVRIKNVTEYQSDLQISLYDGLVVVVSV